MSADSESGAAAKAEAAALRRAIGMLEAILVRQTGLHREMLARAEEKRRSIVGGNLEELERTVAAEKKLVADVENEERKRLAVMPLVRSGLGIDAGTEKLGDVISRFPEPERGRLGLVREELKGVLEEFQIKNRHNAELLRTSLAHVESFLRAVADSVRDGAGYRRDGRPAGGGSAIIDRNA